VTPISISVISGPATEEDDLQAAEPMELEPVLHAATASCIF
jgi:hypothetical protein